MKNDSTKTGNELSGKKLIQIPFLIILLILINFVSIRAQRNVCEPCTPSIGASSTTTYTKPPPEKFTNPPSVITPDDEHSNPNAPGCRANVPLQPPVITPSTKCQIPIKTITNDAPATFPVGTTVVHWTLTDIYGKSTTVSQNVIVVNDLSAAATPVNSSCNGANDGSVLATAAGGTGPYTYQWNNGQTTPGITNLPPADYSVVVTDANGCSSGADASTTEPQPLVATPMVNSNVSQCFGSDGSASVTSAGGTPPVQYSWSDINHQTGPIATNLPAGIYTVMAVDANGCETTGTVEILQGQPEICNNGIDDDCDGQTDEGCINGVTVNLKLLLQGFYSGGGLMDNGGAGGCLFVTSESTDPTDADTVYVSAMDPVPPYGLVEQKTGILKVNGDVSVTFSSSVVQGNQYYIKVNHRNSIETWSKFPVVITNFMTYSFTTSQSTAFGDNLINTFDNMGWAIFSGDINHDGAVDGSDFLELDPSIQAGDGGYANGDLNGDGAVDGTDFLVLDPNVQLGIGAVVP